MTSNIYSLASPSVFTSENYQMWAVRIKTYLQACDFLDVVEQEHDPQPLLVDPTLAQITNYFEERAKKFIPNLLGRIKCNDSWKCCLETTK
jgi:hypothetical protein